MKNPGSKPPLLVHICLKYKIPLEYFLKKRLKDYKGRQLPDEDIFHYQKIIKALTETVRIMREIDEVDLIPEDKS